MLVANDSEVPRTFEELEAGAQDRQRVDLPRIDGK
jgi:hypothetical protein